MPQHTPEERAKNVAAGRAPTDSGPRKKKKNDDKDNGKNGEKNNNENDKPEAKGLIASIGEIVRRLREARAGKRGPGLGVPSIEQEQELMATERREIKEARTGAILKRRQRSILRRREQ